MTKKIIAVAGATGAQGGGLVRSILADPNGEFTVRAITRDPDSPKARALAAAGADVVAADIADLAAVARAFDGAYGAYCVTFFWNHFSPYSVPRSSAPYFLAMSRTISSSAATTFS